MNHETNLLFEFQQDKHFVHTSRFKFLWKSFLSRKEGFVQYEKFVKSNALYNVTDNVTSTSSNFCGKRVFVCSAKNDLYILKISITQHLHKILLKNSIEVVIKKSR